MKQLLSRTRRSDVTFRRNGRITICARSAKAIGLRPGDSINILADGPEYFLYAVHHDNSDAGHVARVHRSNGPVGSFVANSVDLCRSLLSSVGIAADRASFFTGVPLLRAGRTLLPIITTNPL